MDLIDINRKIISYGDPGSGKSEFVASAPKPLIVFFFDGEGKETPYLRRGKSFSKMKTFEFGRSELPYREVYNSKGEVIIRIEYYRDTKPEEPDAARTFKSRIEYFVDPDEEMSVADFASMAHDSSTSCEYFTRKDEQYRLNKKAKDGRQWYGQTASRLEELYFGTYPSLDLNVVVVMHIAQDKDEVLGRLVLTPAAPGKLARRVSGQYAELYHHYVTVDKESGERVFRIQTEGDNRFQAATQIPAPDGCDNNWKALFE